MFIIIMNKCQCCKTVRQQKATLALFPRLDYHSQCKPLNAQLSTLITACHYGTVKGEIAVSSFVASAWVNSCWTCPACHVTMATTRTQPDENHKPWLASILKWHHFSVAQRKERKRLAWKNICSNVGSSTVISSVYDISFSHSRCNIVNKLPNFELQPYLKYYYWNNKIPFIRKETCTAITIQYDRTTMNTLQLVILNIFF